MYRIDMIDSWDRTVATWCVEYSEDVLKQFVDNLNNKSDELSSSVESNERYWFDYVKISVASLPTDEELLEIMKPSEFELSMRNQESSSGLTYEMIKEWDTTKITDMSEMFKNK